MLQRIWLCPQPQEVTSCLIQSRWLGTLMCLKSQRLRRRRQKDNLRQAGPSPPPRPSFQTSPSRKVTTTHHLQRGSGVKWRLALLAEGASFLKARAGEPGLQGGDSPAGAAADSTAGTAAWLRMSPRGTVTKVAHLCSCSTSREKPRLLCVPTSGPPSTRLQAADTERLQSLGAAPGCSLLQGRGLDKER